MNGQEQRNGRLRLGAPGRATSDVAATTARRFLVVEDHVDLADATQLRLERRGHEVRAAYDGRAALKVVEAFRPDVVLLDLCLPDLSGYDLADKLLQHPNARHAKIIVVTAFDPMVDAARGRTRGFIAQMIKPFDLEAVFDLLAMELDGSVIEAP